MAMATMIVMLCFKCNSDGEIFRTSDDASGGEISGNFKQNFIGGDGGALALLFLPRLLVWPIRMRPKRAALNQKHLRECKGCLEIQMQPAVEVNVWGAVDREVWPDNDTKFVGKDAVRGVLNLPRD